MNEIILNHSIKFSSKDTQTILNAALESKISWPHSCENGRCNSCKCKVDHGVTFAISAELGLSTEEISNGWILACVRKAMTNLELSLTYTKNMHSHTTKILPCKIDCIEYLSSNILKIILRFPKNSGFQFTPGQFVNIISPSGIKRSYSIANFDSTKENLEFHIKLFSGGAMSNYWINTAKINDLLRIEGPKGTFGLNSIANKHLIFLATGTGIAPIKAILSAITTLTRSEAPKLVWIFWGNRFVQDFYLDLGELPNVDFHKTVLSKPDSNWGGAVGYVQDELFKIKNRFENCEVYACGSPQMIKDSYFALTKLGLPENCFFSDSFVSTNFF